MSKIPITELIARKLEGLARRIRDGEVRGFTLQWNMDQATQMPHLLCGPMIVHAHMADDYVDCLDNNNEDTAESLQDEIDGLIKGTGIAVEDLSEITHEIVDAEFEVAPMPDDVVDDVSDGRIFDPSSQDPEEE